MKSLGSSVIEIIKAKNKREMLEQKMDDLLSHQRQFVENNRRSLEQKIKEKEKEMEEKNLLRCQSDQKSQEIHQLQEELKTAKQFLKETQNYAEEMKSADEVAIYLHSLTQDNEPEYEPDGLPEVVRKGFADIPTGKTNPCVLCRTALNLKTSARLAAQSQNLSPYGQRLQKGRSANFAKISKLTAGGSKSPKVDDTQQCQAETAIEPMESI
ncbi:centromere protein F-like [Mauremys reevesii]|uniref:centromere protein F-like n=1 Tax=Mauremys reevesii TaxID=260615 RepID=UPI00193F0389|nr:centromere protein F-like [Mauremys reevesii]